MNSLVEVTPHETLFSARDRRDMNGSILDQMFKLDSLHTSQAGDNMLLTERLSTLEALDRDNSPKLLLSAHDGIDYRLGKKGVDNRNIDQTFFDYTSNAILPAPSAILTGTPVYTSLPQLTESPAIPASSISPLSIPRIGNGLRLSWENMENFPTFSSQLASQNSICQFSGFDPHDLRSRHASLPDTDISQFAGISADRKRIVSWADIETDSLGVKNLDQNTQFLPQSSHTLHPPGQSSDINTKPYCSRNTLSINYDIDSTFAKSPVGMDISERNQSKFPIVYKTFPKPKSHSSQTSYNSNSQHQVQEALEINGCSQAERDLTNSDRILQGPEEHSHLKDTREERKRKKGQQKQQTVVERRLSRRRERNRLAARRSREKRNQFLRELEQVNQALSRENEALKASLCEAIQELQILRVARMASNTSPSNTLE